MMRLLKNLIAIQGVSRKVLKIPFYNSTTGRLEYPKGTAVNYINSVLNADGSYSLQLSNGDILQSVAAVYAWPGKTIPNVPTLPNANTFENGAVVRLHQDNFVGFGANPSGIEIQADATNNIWKPHGRQVIWSGFFGLRAAPTVSLPASGRFNIGADPVVPLGLLNYDNARMRCSGWGFISNLLATTGPMLSAHVGTDLTVYSNNPTIINNRANSADNVSFNLSNLLIRASSTAALSTRYLSIGGNGSSLPGLFDVSGGLLNFASEQMITYALSDMGTATQVALHGFEIAWEY